MAVAPNASFAPNTRHVVAGTRTEQDRDVRAERGGTCRVFPHARVGLVWDINGRCPFFCARCNFMVANTPAVE